MKASVIICTFNRSKLLSETVRSVQLQDFSPEQYEIIIVDNNSTDDTRNVIENLTAASPVRIKYIFEGKQGLSYARNAGIRNAKGKVLVFTDDDIEAEASWLRNIVSVFDTPDVGAAGGPIRPVWLADKPDWLTKKWEGHLTINEFQSALESGIFKGPEYPWGANMAFRKDVFRTTGMFPKDLGRRGKQLLSNEELELCKRIEQSGKKILFAHDAVIHHKIQDERLTKQWFYHRTYWQGRSDAVLDINSKADVYARIRQRASEMMWIETDNKTVEFDKECVRRSTIGYLQQLLVMGKGKDIEYTFGKLRILATFLSEICVTLSNMAADKNNKIDELAGFIDEKLEDLKRFTVLVDRKDEQIIGLDTELKNRNLEIFRRDELIIQKDEEIKLRDAAFDDATKRKEEDIRRLSESISKKDEDLKQFAALISQKDESLRLADSQLFETNERLRLKDENLRSVHTQLVESNEQLRLKDESLRLANSQLFETNEQLKLKDENLRLVNSQLFEANEQLKLKDENLRLVNSQLFETNEQLRLKDESLRLANSQLFETNEQLRLKDESLRLANSQLFETNEQLRLKDESLRLSQEQLLESNEQSRQKDESLRSVQEQLRLIEESLRLSQEQLLESNKQSRQKDESLRSVQEQLRRIEESLRSSQEKLLESNKQSRQKDESLRSVQEQLRRIEESLRSSQEKLLESNEQSRLKSDQINQKDKWIADLINSKSWKITRPLRAVVGLFKKGNGT